MERENKRQKPDREDDHGQLGNGIETLPRDVILDIVSRLPVNSIIQFRFVCRAFYSLTLDSDLVRMNLSRALKTSPYLIFHSDYPLNNHLYFVECPGRSEDPRETIRVGKLPTPFSNSMPEFQVVGSCDGMLCLLNSLFNDVLSVYNPFTRQYRELPRSIEFENQRVVYGFGSHPLTREYKVIKIIYYLNTYNEPSRMRRLGLRRCFKSEVQVFSLGGARWRSIGEAPYQVDTRSTEALLNGRLHWMSKYRRDAKRIVSFDISDETFREVPLPECMPPLTLFGYHLVVLNRCLSLALPVRGREGGFDIWMMKEYDVKESWVKQYCVEGYKPKPIPELHRNRRIWRSFLWMRCFKVLCVLGDGEILIQYRGGTLVAYNPESGAFKRLSFPGMPNLFQTVTHVGSLTWVG